MRVDIRRALRVACVFALVCLPTFAHAWGPTGHRVVATLAEQHLTPTTRKAVRELLAPTHDHTLADVADWADELRDDPRERTLWRATSKLHFVNFKSSSCRYDAARDCAGGRCVVAAIDRYADVLGDDARPREERAQALRFLVHFVADVHQPLHAGYRHDGGGNRYQVRYDGRGSNLHALWDTPVLAAHGWQRYAAQLARTPLPVVSGRAQDWAEESCRATRDAGIYPAAHRIDVAYLDRMRPLAQRRLREAAVRLAALLNTELDRRR